MKHLKLFLILLILVNLFGCGKRPDGHSYIINDSSEQFSLEFVRNGRKTATLIKAHTIYRTHSFLGDDGKDLGSQCCICEFDSIVIATSDTTKQIIRSITSEEDWDKSAKDFGTRTAEFYCRFIISDNDIE